MHHGFLQQLGILWLGLGITTSLLGSTATPESSRPAPQVVRHVLDLETRVVRGPDVVNDEFIRAWDLVLAQNLDPGIASIEITLVKSHILGDQSVFGIAYAGTRNEGKSFSGLAVLLVEGIPADDLTGSAIFATRPLARWASNPEGYKSPESGMVMENNFKIPGRTTPLPPHDMVKGVHQDLIEWQARAPSRLRDSRYVASMDAYEKSKLEMRLHVQAKVGDPSQFRSVEEIRACREIVRRAREVNSNWLELLLAPDGVPDVVARKPGGVRKLTRMRQLDAEYFDQLDALFALVEREFGAISRASTSARSLLSGPVRTGVVFQNPAAMAEYRAIMAGIQRVANAQNEIAQPPGPFDIQSTEMALLIQQAAKARESVQPALRWARDFSLLASADQAGAGQKELNAAGEALTKLSLNLQPLLEQRAMPYLTEGERYRYHDSLRYALLAEAESYRHAGQMLQLAASSWGKWTLAATPGTEESTPGISRPGPAFDSPEDQAAYVRWLASFDKAAKLGREYLETVTFLDQRIRERAQSTQPP